MFRYGTGADEWRVIEYDWCDKEVYEPDDENFGRYRWGYQDLPDEGDHWLGGTIEYPASPKTGTLKFRRDGDLIYAWDGIAGDWHSFLHDEVSEYIRNLYDLEPIVFPKDSEIFEVSFGVHTDWHYWNPTVVDFDNFSVTFP